jgi:hypothetical protein
VEEGTMVGKRYRLRTPTLAIMEHDGHRLPVTVPLGGVVQVIAGPVHGERLVDVEWEGKPLLMFAVDLHARGELVEGAAN